MRVVTAYWKKRGVEQLEVFSNLKLFCDIHPQFSYNTLNNYLSKSKVAFENDEVRVERKPVINKPQPAPERQLYKIVPVATRQKMGAISATDDLQYWLTKTPGERIAAATFIVQQSLRKGQHMDRTAFSKRKLKP